MKKVGGVPFRVGDRLFRTESAVGGVEGESGFPNLSLFLLVVIQVGLIWLVCANSLLVVSENG